MRKIDLLRALGDVDAEFLDESQETTLDADSYENKKTWRKLTPFAAVAASQIIILAVLFALASGFFGNKTDINPQYAAVKERSTLAEIKLQLQSDLDNNNSRITVRDAYVSNALSMPTYSVEIGGKNMHDISPLASYLLGDKYDTTDDTLYATKLGTEPIYPEYATTDYPIDIDGDGKADSPNSHIIDMYSFFPDENDPNLYVGTHSTGLVAGYQDTSIDIDSNVTDRYNLLNSSGNIVYERRFIDAEWEICEYDTTQIYYRMYDGNFWSLADAIIYAENFFNSQLLNYETDNVYYKAKYVDVVKIGDDCYGYYIVMGCFDENSNCIDSSDYFSYDWESIGNGEPFYIENECYLWTYKKDTACYFQKEFALKNRTALDNGDELLTLSAAIDILSVSLPKNSSYVIPCAELCYMTTCLGYGEIFDEWQVDRTKEDFACDYYFSTVCMSKCEFELRPVWVFKTKDYSDIEVGQGKIFIVDAKTGDVFIAEG